MRSFFLFAVFFFSFSSLVLTAQNEAGKWYFGENAGLDFMTNPPTVLTNGQINTYEGVATISDAAGNLLFYTDGISVYDKTHALMSNGNGLSGNPSSSQSAVIVRKPGSNSIYYVFTQSGGPSALSYSTVDLTQNGGNGAVTVKNTSLVVTNTEYLTSALHCNGTDVWILTHMWNSADFYAFLVTSSGVNTTPVITTIGSSSGWGIGHLKISPDGTRIGAALWGQGMFEIYDFDNTTGVLSNSLNLGTGFQYAYGCEFSPDSKLFYGNCESSLNIYQWDICSTNSTAIVASKNIVGTASGVTELGAMQIAPNQKIYVSRYKDGSLCTIDNPNVYGTGCNFVNVSQMLGGKKAILGLPNFVANILKPALPTFSYTADCNNLTFTAPSPTYALGVCGATVATGVYSWDFGDPASGATNTSTLANPVHKFSSKGSYNVTLQVSRNCGGFESVKTLVTTGNITFTASGTGTICSGNSTTLTAGGASTYSWNNGMQGPKIVVNPGASVYYIVYAFNADSSCTANQILHVNVLKCTGIEEIDGLLSFRAYPNPNKGTLNVETGAPGNLEIMDQLGRLVLIHETGPGKQTIDISMLSTGFYYVKFSNAKTCAAMRLEKTD